MTDTTILYYTDNSLDKNIFELCQKYLIIAAGKNKILCVSHKPINFGDENICIGDIGRTLETLSISQITAIKNAKTKYIAFAEHDCIYSPDHFNFIPPRDDIFYYNTNMWHLHCGTKDPELNRLFSYIPKRKPEGEFKIPQSQMIVNRELALEAYETRLELIRTCPLSTALPAEPGVMKKRAMRLLEEQKNFPLLEWAKKYNADKFSFDIPNLDIQHGDNFSRRRFAKVGKKKTNTLPFWGTVEDVLGGKSYGQN